MTRQTTSFPIVSGFDLGMGTDLYLEFITVHGIPDFRKDILVHSSKFLNIQSNICIETSKLALNF